MKTINRIKEFIDYKGISLNAFDKLIGAGNAYIGKAVKNNSSIGSDVLEKIISIYPELDPSWLMSGVGEMLKTEKNYTSTPPGDWLLNEEEVHYGRLPPTPQSDIHAKKLHPTLHPTANYDVKQIYLAPQIITVDNAGNENILHVSARAAAGYLKGYADKEYLEKLPAFNLPGLTDATYRSFIVDGDSMNPTLKNGQMVIGRWVEKLDYIRDDRVHILVTKHDGIIIKRVLNRIEQYNKIIAKSDATNDRELYKNIEVPPEDILEIWYAVFHGGFDFQSPTDMWKRVNNHEADITVIMSALKAKGFL